MCKNKIKICMILLLFVFITNISIPAYASVIDEIWNTGAEFLERGKSGGATFNGDNMKAAVDDLYNLFLWAGIVIAVIVGAFLGVKFMTESVEGKAKIKEALIPFCVGCVIIFGGFTIWRIAMNLFNDLEKTETGTVAVQEYREEQCAAGKHSYDNFLDIYCNNSKCNEPCYHVMGSANSSGTMTCKRGCGLTTTSCLRKSEQHSYSDGICQKCGYVCTHSRCVEESNKQHKCEYCQKTLNHEGMIVDGVCDVCQARCANHQPYLGATGQYVKCDNCKSEAEQCEYMGADNHNWDNAHYPNYCKKCGIKYSN